MKKIDWLVSLIGVIGFLLIVGTGVDLIYIRTGVGMLVLSVAIALLAFKPGEGFGQTGRCSLMLIVLLGAAYFIGRALIAGPVGLAVSDIVQVVLFLGVYYLVAASNHQFKRAMIVGLGVLCLVQLGVVAYQMLSGSDFFVWKDNAKKFDNKTGLFGHYNPFASFLNGSLFFFLSYLFLGKHTALKLLCGFLVVGILSGLISSGSRGGWLAFLIGAGVWLLLLTGYLWRRQSKLLGPVVLVGALVLILGAFSSIWVVKKMTAERVGQEVERMDDANFNDGGRLPMQQMAFEIFLDSPALGRGPRSFSYLSLEYWDPDTLWIRIGLPEFAHNEYLQALADYGAVGLLIILILLIVHGSLGVYQIVGDSDGDEKERDLPIWKLGAAAGLAAILAQCYFSFLIHVPACVALVALQLGILGSAGERRRMSVGARILGRTVVICVAVITGILGWRFTSSFLDRREALDGFHNVVGESDALSLISQLESAGALSWDPTASERAGQELMNFAMLADESRDVELAWRLRERAKVSFEKALNLNPHSFVAICGIPQIEDALGNFEAADAGHRFAMEKLWPLEYHLRPHFFAARSAYAKGYVFYREGQEEEAEKLYRIARERVDRHRKVFGYARSDSRKMKATLDSWLAYLEGVRLVDEGDRAWSMRPRKPENAERAHALMLAAKDRFVKSRKVFEGVDPRWETRWEKLQGNLGNFAIAKVAPAELTPGEVEAIAIPEAVLDSKSENR